MPFIKDTKKEPLSKGFSSIILKWCSCDMFTPGKSDKKRARFFNF
jgi:hypothetical protein